MNTFADAPATSEARAPWCTAGGAATRRGLFPGTARIEAKPARVLAATGAVQTSVVFDARERAFIADMPGRVEAFTRSGRLLWQQRLEGGVSATPTLDPGGTMLFAGTHAGWVYALDPSSGSVAWRTEVPTRSDARILSDLLYSVKRRAVILSSWGGRFVALDHATGKERQSWDAGVSPYAAAAADADDNVYCVRAVQKVGVQLIRISPDGREAVLYQQDESGGPANRAMTSAAPVVDSERKTLYFVLNSGRGGSLNAWGLQSEQLRWGRHFPAALGATPSIAWDGSIAVADMAGFIHALEPDGSVRYRYASGCDYLLAGAVCERSGNLFIADPLGVVHMIERTGVGKPVFELPRSVQARPSFDSVGNLYVPASDRRVYVFANSRVPAA